AVVDADPLPPGPGRRQPGEATVPPSIQASLHARLDRLREAREVAQVAAAIGRDFSLDLLGQVAGLGEAELGNAMARMLAAGLVRSAGATSPGRYRFKHALIRDAAYSTIIRSRRRDLHARIGRALVEARVPERATARPQLIAWHFTEAGLAAEAAAWWL
ncbi:hypothetical protein QC334_38130, partial [Streptomyces sp. DH18]|nr:hypothetical protein [Streptomyces sp. DH18]